MELVGPLLPTCSAEPWAGGLTWAMTNTYFEKIRPICAWVRGLEERTPSTSELTLGEISTGDHTEIVGRCPVITPLTPVPITPQGVGIERALTASDSQAEPASQTEEGELSKCFNSCNWSNCTSFCEPASWQDNQFEPSVGIQLCIFCLHLWKKTTRLACQIPNTFACWKLPSPLTQDVFCERGTYYILQN